MQEDDGYLFTLTQAEEENKDEEFTLSYDFSNNTTQYRIKALVSEMTEKDTNGNTLISIPDLQRGPEVWNEARQSRLILSLIRNIPIPPMYFFQKSNSSQLEIIDGLQRATAIKKFLDGNLTLSLPGTDYHKMTINDSIFEQNGFKNKVILVTIVKQNEPDQSESGKYEIFKILNQNSSPLTSQEIRNCVYESDFTRFIKEINQTKEWRLIYGLNDNPSRCRAVDEEMIVRAYFMLTEISAKNLSHGINALMYNYKKNPEELLQRKEEMEKIFTTACTMLQACDIQYNLQKSRSRGDAILGATMKYAYTKKILPKDFASRYDKLLVDKEFIKNTKDGTGTIGKVKGRLEIAYSILFGD